jgi:hypothetical protein
VLAHVPAVHEVGVSVSLHSLAEVLVELLVRNAMLVRVLPSSADVRGREQSLPSVIEVERTGEPDLVFLKDLDEAAERHVAPDNGIIRHFCFGYDPLGRFGGHGTTSLFDSVGKFDVSAAILPRHREKVNRAPLPGSSRCLVEANKKLDVGDAYRE